MRSPAKRPNELHCMTVSPGGREELTSLAWLLCPSTRDLPRGVLTPHTSGLSMPVRWAKVCSVPYPGLGWRQEAGSTDKREDLCKVTGSSFQMVAMEINGKTGQAHRLWIVHKCYLSIHNTVILLPGISWRVAGEDHIHPQGHVY